MSKIDEAKAQVSLAEVARRTGILVPEGATGDVMVQCPMPYPGTEGEVAPANAVQLMRLRLDSNRWYCFGCAHRGLPHQGDVVQWVQNLEGLDAVPAAKKLLAGGPITNHWPANPAGGKKVTQVGNWEHPDLKRTIRERVLEVLATAWGYYSGPGGHKKGVAYLGDRTIDVEVLEAHTGRPEVGHTPRVGRTFIKKMHEAGITDDELVDANLVYRSSRGVSPVYSDRVLIPCRDEDGNVVGFFGRDVTGTRPKGEKYVNLTTTAVYNKSVNLYQPLPSPTDANGQVVIVEGTLDAIAISVAAIQQQVPPMFCPVTQSGKTLSDAQLDKVLAMSPKAPVVAFDGDSAGRPANVALARRITERGRECVVTDLPTTQDPAEYLAEHGPEGLAAWTRFGALNADGSTTRPVYGPAFVLDQTWRTEVAKALKASEDGDVDWAEVLAKTEYEGFRMRAYLPVSTHARYDTQVSKALAPHVAFESVRHIEHQMGDERNDKVEWTDPSGSPKARAAGVAKRSQMWLSRFPRANPARVEPVLVAKLVRAAGDDPDMAALLPKAVQSLAQHPAKADQLAEMGHWEPPFIELPEASGI